MTTLFIFFGAILFVLLLIGAFSDNHSASRPNDQPNLPPFNYKNGPYNY